MTNDSETKHEPTDQNYARFLQNRNYLNEIEKHNLSLLDKSILAISSTALGLSLAFISSIIKDNQTICKNILLISWVFLVVSISLNLISYKLGADETRAEKRKQDKSFSENGDFDYSPMKREWTSRANTGALVSLVFGLIFLIWFSYVNVR